MFADDVISSKLMELNPKFAQAVVTKKALEKELKALELNDEPPQDSVASSSTPASNPSNANARGQLVLLRQSILDRESAPMKELQRRAMDMDSAMVAYFKLCGQLVQASTWLESWRERSVEPRIHFHVVYPLVSMSASLNNPTHPWFEGAVVAASITTEYPSTGQMELGTVEPPSTTECSFFISPEGIMYREEMLEEQLRVLTQNMAILKFRLEPGNGSPQPQAQPGTYQSVQNRKTIPLSDNRVEYALQRCSQIPL